MPRRRWEGNTPTAVTPPTGIGPPGTVMVRLSTEVTPTSRSPSNAPSERSNSVVPLKSFSRCGGTAAPNASSSTVIQPDHSLSVTGRRLMLIFPTVEGMEGSGHLLSTLNDQGIGQVGCPKGG